MGLRSFRWPLGLAAAAALLWLALTWLLPPLAERWLVRRFTDAGLPVQLRVTRLGLNRAEFASIHLGTGPDSSWIGELAVDYTPAGLRRRQIDRVVADNVVLTLRRTAAGWIVPGANDALPPANPGTANSAKLTAGDAFPVAEVLLRNVTVRLLSDTAETRIRGHATVQLPDRRLVRFEAAGEFAAGTVRLRGSVVDAGRSGTALVEAGALQTAALWTSADTLGLLPTSLAVEARPVGTLSGRQFVTWRDGRLGTCEGTWSLTDVAWQREAGLAVAAASVTGTIRDERWSLAANGVGLTFGGLPPVTGAGVHADGTLTFADELKLTADCTVNLPVWQGELRTISAAFGPGDVTGKISWTTGTDRALLALENGHASLPCELRNRTIAAKATVDMDAALRLENGSVTGHAELCARHGQASGAGVTGEFEALRISSSVNGLRVSQFADSATSELPPIGAQTTPGEHRRSGTPALHSEPLPSSVKTAFPAKAACAPAIAGELLLTNGTVSHASGVRAAGIQLATPFVLGSTASGLALASLGSKGDSGQLTCHEISWRDLTVDGFALAWTPTDRGARATGSGQVRQSAAKFSVASDVTWTPNLAVQGELTCPVVRLTQADPLAATFAPLPAGFEVAADVGGRLTFRLSGTQPLALNGTVSVANGELNQTGKNLALHGIATTLEIEDLLACRSAGGQELTVASADVVGQRVGPVRVRYRVESRTSLFLEQAEAGWANGTIRGYAFRFNPLQPEGDVTLYADRIEVQGVLGLMKNFRGDAAGVLYGRLPLKIRGSTIELSEGFLFSPPGQAGQLRLAETGWLPGALTQSGVPDSAVQRVKSALGDFEFSIFRLDLETTAPKEALLRLRLVGGARQDKTAPPVDLNINVRGPLQGLLNLGLQFAR